MHVTDVTNASRTMLMDLRTLQWDEEILAAMNVPKAVLPEIRSSSEVYGTAVGQLAGVPVASALGDQQAAIFGQACYDTGTAKNTYGTGSFLLLNTGNRPVPSKSGLITTLGYKIGDESPVYCLEGSIAITGALVQWFRDQLGIIRSAGEIETLAASVEDNGGAYIVPAFSGLYAPYWRSDARGVVTGLTRYVTKAHLARAVLEATSWQTREVVDAMYQDSGVQITTLKVDGGMTANHLLMQHQADVLGVPVIRPKVSETTCLGAAYAAGLATGVWADLDELKTHWQRDVEWSPRMEAEVREREYHNWRKAVEKSFGWEEGAAGARGRLPDRPWSRRSGLFGSRAAKSSRPVPRSVGVRAVSVPGAGGRGVSSQAPATWRGGPGRGRWRSQVPAVAACSRTWSARVSACSTTATRMSLTDSRERASPISSGTSGSRSRAARTDSSGKRFAPSKQLTATANGMPLRSK